MKTPLLCWLAAACGLGAAQAQERSAADLRRNVEQGLRGDVLVAGRPVWTLAERMKQLNVPGVGIAVIRDSRTEWTGSYGVRDRDSGEPVTGDTLFQVASISKTFTAVTVLRLVEKGLLDLDRDVNDYLRSWKVPENEFTRGKKVTLRRLLSHDAGMTVSGFRGYAESEPVPTILQVLDGQPPANNASIRVDREPGSGFRYSGGGYTVVQLVLEQVTGHTLAELFREHIFGPLGMGDSTLDPDSEPFRGRPRAKAHVDGVPRRGHRFLPGGSGCCEVWTTPGDLARFAISLQRALRGERDAVVSPETARLAMTPASSPTMGLGFMLLGEGTPAYFNHSGGNVGFSSVFVAGLSSGDGIAVTANSGSGIINQVLNGAAVVYGWKQLAPPEFASMKDLATQIRGLREKAPGDPRISENGLNRLGYQMLNSGLTAEAVEVFRLIAGFFPLSANAQDSLAEACNAAGDLPAALQHYRQALDNLDRHPEVNAGYARHREAVKRKIAELEERLAKK